MLKKNFIDLAGKYNDDTELARKLWKEIEAQYSDKSRHYHTLLHLEHLLDQLTHVKADLKKYDVLLFSMYYHDIIYNSLKSDNEEKSAALAEKRLRQLSVPEADIKACTAMILATKSHLTSSNEDINYFTDADLSVLGQSWDDYALYFKNVRKEYAVYPDIIYKPGRKKVLQHFLEMNRIFKTDFFFKKFEHQAKENLKKELALL